MFREAAAAATEAVPRAALAVTVVAIIVTMALAPVPARDRDLEEVVVTTPALLRVLTPEDTGLTLAAVRLAPTLARVLVPVLARIDTVLIVIGLHRPLLINLLNKVPVYFSWRRAAVST